VIVRRSSGIRGSSILLSPAGASALDDGGNPADEDEANPVAAKSGEERGETTWRQRHGEAL
jgi:hypothetical protein